MVKKIKKRTPKIIPKAAPQIKVAPIKKTKIRVIGIGGGGGSIVSEISTKIKKATFLAANTDRQALKGISRKALRFQFGQSLTRGLGTGMNREIAQIAAQGEKEKIKKLLTGQDLCIFVACLGGGTSSGATPIFTKISRNLGNISYGIFTLPFKFEGEKKAQIAREALEKLKPNLNAISIIPNEKIFQIIDKSTPLKTALSAINKNLAESLEALLETIYEPGLINIDFADLRTIFEGRGRLTYLNSVEVLRQGKDEEIIKKILHSPLYPYTIRGAKGILFNITGEKNLALSEISQISKSISDSVNPEAKIIFGISQKKGEETRLAKGKIKITLLATGCGQRVFPMEVKKLRRKRKKTTPPPRTGRPATRERLAGRPPSRKRAPKRKKIKTKKIVKKSRILKQKIKSKGKRKKQGKVKKRLRPTHRPFTRPKKEHRPARTKTSPVASQKKETEEKPSPQPPIPSKIEVKIRRNALEIKKDIEAEEKEIIAEEKKWETPAFLRRKLENKNNAKPD